MVNENDLAVSKEMLGADDYAAFTLSRARKELALAHAEKAVVQHELAEMSHENLALRLAVRYGLTDGDKITDKGEIMRTSRLATTIEEENGEMPTRKNIL